jgi:hypothetical protein
MATDDALGGWDLLLLKTWVKRLPGCKGQLPEDCRGLTHGPLHAPDGNALLHEHTWFICMSLRIAVAQSFWINLPLFHPFSSCLTSSGDHTWTGLLA